jgi:hypothetical protein
MLNLMSLASANFSQYVPQTEQSMDESNNINEWTKTQQQQQTTTTNNIPSLMSISVTPPIIQQKSTVPASVIKENIEPLPFPQRSPGPIQRPNKLPCSTTTTQQSSFLTDSTQSPSTPDVLVQINHILDHQNSITTVPSTPNVPNTPATNDISTPNASWTPFAPPGWPLSYESSWPGTNLQSPNVPLTSQMQNPFAQRQMSKEDASVWSSALGTATPRSTSSNIRMERPATWNELFPTGVPSSTEPTKSANNSWSKFWPISDQSPSVGTPSNIQPNETNNPFWNPITETQQNSSTPWWPKTPSDENNNDNDKSRWDFAR